MCTSDDSFVYKWHISDVWVEKVKGQLKYDIPKGFAWFSEVYHESHWDVLLGFIVKTCDLWNFNW